MSGKKRKGGNESIAKELSHYLDRDCSSVVTDYIQDLPFLRELSEVMQDVRQILDTNLFLTKFVSMNTVMNMKFESITVSETGYAMLRIPGIGWRVAVSTRDNEIYVLAF
jgi:hypothetical protein